VGDRRHSWVDDCALAGGKQTSRAERQEAALAKHYRERL
jgi:hypothetical protein